MHVRKLKHFWGRHVVMGGQRPVAAVPVAVPPCFLCRETALIDRAGVRQQEGGVAFS